MFKKIRNSKGFTLIELMIVIVIIGILSSIGIPRFRTVTARAKLVECKPLLEQICALQENFHLENDTYTSDFGLLGFDDPKARYFSFSIESDSSSFTASAKCVADIKGEKGESLKGMYLFVNQNGEKGGDIPLRRMARW